MDLSNMFSDLAPISNNGYRQQLNTDPGILQGVEFLQNENKVKKEVEQNLDLNLVSDSNGMESATVHSAGVLNSEDELGNIEGFKENMDAPTTKYYNDLKAQYKIALDKFNALVRSSKIRSFFKCDRRNNSYCIFKDYYGDGATCFGPTNEQHYNNRPAIGQGGLPNYDNNQFVAWLDTLYDINRGSDPSRSDRVNVVDYVSRCNNAKGYEYLKNTKAYKALPDEDLKKQLDALSTEMANISSLMMSSVKDNTNREFSSYNKMQKDIDNVQKRIIEVDGIMKKNATKEIYDIDTSLAKEEETALLSKQRYYVYIIWFVILVIILYITISNLVNPESSFSVLLVTLVLLVLLFLFFMYSKWNTEWYDLKVNLKNLSFSLPDIPKIDFNPLVSVKYTS